MLKTILIVDDDSLDRRRLTRALNSQYKAVEADSEQAAREIVSDLPVHCVLLDYRIPGSDAFSLIDFFDKEKKIPVVMLTGEGSEEVAVQAMKLGAKDYLVKEKLTTEILERAIRTALEKDNYERELLRKHQELEDFAYVASHDLQSPLMKIRQAAELLKRQGDKIPVQKLEVLLDIVLRGCDQMTTLVHDLLEYSRTGRGTANFKYVNLEELANSVIETLAPTIEEQGASVQLSDLPVVHGDSTGLFQLFQNLISNGLKYCEAETPEVRVSCEESEDYWKLFFKDNGIGIAEEHHNSVFKPFERLHTQTEYEGSGIGLATCHKVAEQHGGRIQLESAPGKGSTFIVSLAKSL